MSDAQRLRRAAQAASNNRRAAEATARAEAAKAQAAATLAGAEQRRLAAAAEARRFDRENSITGKSWQMGVNVVMPIAGIAAGYKMASGIEKRHVAAVAVRNTQLREVARGISRTMSSSGKTASAIASRNAKLAGSIITADKLRLAAARGPAGLGMAGILLAEGAFARFGVAPSIKNETAAEIVRGAGSAFAFAATTMIAKRVIANATPKAIPAGASMATVEAARRMPGVAAAMAAQTPKMGLGARLLSIAGKVALPVAAAAAGYAAFQGYKRAGAGGAALAAGDSLTFGLATPVARLAGYTPQSRVAARVALARSAGTRAATAVQRHTVAGAHLRRIAAGNGMTKAYTRVQGGKSVRVQGYKTPKRMR